MKRNVNPMKRMRAMTLMLVLGCLMASVPAKAAPNLELVLKNFNYVTNDNYRVFLETCGNTPIGNGIGGVKGLVFQIVPNGANKKPCIFSAATLCCAGGSTVNVTNKFAVSGGNGCQDTFGCSLVTTFNGAGANFHVFVCDSTPDPGNACKFKVADANSVPPGGCNICGTCTFKVAVAHGGPPCVTGNAQSLAAGIIVQNGAVTGGILNVTGGANGLGATSNFTTQNIQVVNIVAPEVNTRSSAAPICLALGALLVLADRRRKKLAVPQN